MMASAFAEAIGSLLVLLFSAWQGEFDSYFPLLDQLQ